MKGTGMSSSSCLERVRVQLRRRLCWLLGEDLWPDSPLGFLPKYLQPCLLSAFSSCPYKRKCQVNMQLTKGNSKQLWVGGMLTQKTSRRSSVSMAVEELWAPKQSSLPSSWVSLVNEVSAAWQSAARQASPFPTFFSGHPSVRNSCLQMRGLNSWKSYWILRKSQHHCGPGSLWGAARQAGSAQSCKAFVL